MAESSIFAGKVAIVTGASSGIGRVIARRLGEQRCTTVLAARRSNELKALQNEIAELGSDASVFQVDLSDNQQLERLVQHTLEQHRTIDFLINNAGWGRKASVMQGRVEDWENTFRVNLLAPMVLSKLVLPTLVERGGGAVVNIASISGRAGQAGAAAYAASKAGLIAFTQSMYEEVREHRIKVAAILPGFVDTPMIPRVGHLDRSKMVQPDDVAQTVMFVLGAPATSCPVEITLRPQQTPYK